MNINFHVFFRALIYSVLLFSLFSCKTHTALENKAESIDINITINSELTPYQFNLEFENALYKKDKDFILSLIEQEVISQYITDHYPDEQKKLKQIDKIMSNAQPGKNLATIYSNELLKSLTAFKYSFNYLYSKKDSTGEFLNSYYEVVNDTPIAFFIFKFTKNYKLIEISNPTLYYSSLEFFVKTQLSPFEYNEPNLLKTFKLLRSTALEGDTIKFRHLLENLEPSIKNSFFTYDFFLRILGDSSPELRQHLIWIINDEIDHENTKMAPYLSESHVDYVKNIYQYAKDLAAIVENNSFIYATLALSSALKGNDEEALGYIRSSLINDPNDYVSILSLVDASVYTGRHDLTVALLSYFEKHFEESFQPIENELKKDINLSPEYIDFLNSTTYKNWKIQK